MVFRGRFLSFWGHTRCFSHTDMTTTGALEVLLHSGNLFYIATGQSVCSKESDTVPRDLSTTLEHYIETIHDLQKEWGAASVTDIAEKRGVKSPSVTYVLQKLKALGLVRYKKYRSVTLTPAGLKIAKKFEKTRSTLTWFLTLVGVSEEVAIVDACELEHHIHPETMARLTEFTEWVKGAPKDLKWVEHFEEYRRTGKRVKECDGDTWD